MIFGRSSVVIVLSLAMLGGNIAAADSHGHKARPDITATNAFYYYADVDAAWEFYRDILGLETVVEYGFAKIMRLASSSYVTLVDAAEGMHSADEPKTVTLTLVTDEVEGWYTHLQSSGVSFFAEPGAGPDIEFVALDPEGYYLKFRQADGLASKAFDGLEPVSSSAAPVGIIATVYSIYVGEVGATAKFYEGLLGIESLGNYLYQVAGSGFLRLVDGSDELHRATEENGVALTFLTSDIDAWFERAVDWPGFALRTPEVLAESGLVRVFVGYDPEGYFLEWDTFLEVEENAALLRYLPQR